MMAASASTSASANIHTTFTTRPNLLSSVSLAAVVMKHDALQAHLPGDTRRQAITYLVSQSNPPNRSNATMPSTITHVETNIPSLSLSSTPSLEALETKSSFLKSASVSTFDVSSVASSTGLRSNAAVVVTDIPPTAPDLRALPLRGIDNVTLSSAPAVSTAVPTLLSTALPITGQTILPFLLPRHNGSATTNLSHTASFESFPPFVPTEAPSPKQSSLTKSPKQSSLTKSPPFSAFSTSSSSTVVTKTEPLAINPTEASSVEPTIGTRINIPHSVIEVSSDSLQQFDKRFLSHAMSSPSSSSSFSSSVTPTSDAVTEEGIRDSRTGRGVTTTGRGVTTTGRGVTTTGCGVTTTGCGVATTGCGVATTGCGVTVTESQTLSSLATSVRTPISRRRSKSPCPSSFAQSQSSHITSRDRYNNTHQRSSPPRISSSMRDHGRDSSRSPLPYLSRSSHSSSYLRTSSSLYEHAKLRGRSPVQKDKSVKRDTRLSIGDTRVSTGDDARKRSRSRSHDRRLSPTKRVRTGKSELTDPPPMLSVSPRAVEDSAHGFKLWVRNLPSDVTTKELRACFEKYGTVISTNVPQTKKGKPRRYGFCVFAKEFERARVLTAPIYLRPTHQIRCELSNHQQIEPASNNTRVLPRKSAVATTATERIESERSAVRRLTRLQIMQVQDLRRQQAIDRCDPVSLPPSPRSGNTRPCWNYQYSRLGCNKYNQCTFTHTWQRRANPPFASMRNYFQLDPSGHWQAADVTASTEDLRIIREIQQGAPRGGWAAVATESKGSKSSTSDIKPPKITSSASNTKVVSGRGRGANATTNSSAQSGFRTADRSARATHARGPDREYGYTRKDVSHNSKHSDPLGSGSRSHSSSPFHSRGTSSLSSPLPPPPPPPPLSSSSVSSVHATLPVRGDMRDNMLPDEGAYAYAARLYAKIEGWPMDHDLLRQLTREQIMLIQDWRKSRSNGRVGITTGLDRHGNRLVNMHCFHFQFNKIGCSKGTTCLYTHNWERRANPPATDLQRLFSGNWERLPSEPHDHKTSQTPINDTKSSRTDQTPRHSSLERHISRESHIFRESYTSRKRSVSRERPTSSDRSSRDNLSRDKLPRDHISRDRKSADRTSCEHASHDRTAHDRDSATDREDLSTTPPRDLRIPDSSSARLSPLQLTSSIRSSSSSSLSSYISGSRDVSRDFGRRTGPENDRRVHGDSTHGSFSFPLRTASPNTKQSAFEIDRETCDDHRHSHDHIDARNLGESRDIPIRDSWISIKTTDRRDRDSERKHGDNERKSSDGERIHGDGERIHGDGERIHGDGERIHGDGERIHGDGGNGTDRHRMRSPESAHSRVTTDHHRDISSSGHSGGADERGSERAARSREPGYGKQHESIETDQQTSSKSGDWLSPSRDWLSSSSSSSTSLSEVRTDTDRISMDKYYRVWVNGLPVDTTPDVVRTLFTPFGTLREVTIPEQNHIGKGYIYALVDFEREQDRARVLDQTVVTMSDGRTRLRCRLPTTEKAGVGASTSQTPQPHPQQQQQQNVMSNLTQERKRANIMRQQDARRTQMHGRTEVTRPGTKNKIPCWMYQHDTRGCMFGKNCEFGHHWERRANPPQRDMRNMFAWNSHGWEEAPSHPPPLP
jgi:RNA recognition motif-containing protein